MLVNESCVYCGTKVTTKSIAKGWGHYARTKKRKGYVQTECRMCESCYEKHKGGCSHNQKGGETDA